MRPAVSSLQRSEGAKRSQSVGCGVWDEPLEDRDKGVVRTNPIPFRWAGHGRSRPCYGDGPVAGTANVPNEPNSDGLGPEREGLVNKQNQSGGLGHGRDAHATGDGSVTGAANMRNEPNSNGLGPEREGLVNKRSQFDGLGHGRSRPCYGDDPVGEIPQHSSIPSFQRSSVPIRHSSIPSRCRWYKQSQSAPGEKSGPLQLRCRSQRL